MFNSAEISPAVTGFLKGGDPWQLRPAVVARFEGKVLMFLTRHLTDQIYTTHLFLVIFCDTLARKEASLVIVYNIVQI